MFVVYMGVFVTGGGVLLQAADVAAHVGVCCLALAHTPRTAGPGKTPAQAHIGII